MVRPAFRYVCAAVTGAVIGALVFSLASCGGGPDQAKCRAALVQQWKEALGNPTTVTPGTEPAPCKGLDAATLQRLWSEAGNQVIG